MFNGHPDRVRQVREALEASDVLESVDEIQHATRITARCDVGRATILVFNTGTILVQGRPSSLEKWLTSVKECVITGRDVPRFLEGEAETPETPRSTGEDFLEVPPFD